ncbi:LamG-like jellyroll fold domain-containing protein [Streptomyces gilvus]|uniref:LamG-like jellyroll fold domain-containing protein n=1 Tax=Streptomyces gilvus TaxID=2920937 RepID=UPI001F0F07E5|nr:LamG-like jellyroll fold domain-containing protein [Streptomyces sp. CME 23]MCH5672358.1 DNA/RNA non-specific endonuclease [Streptomyces sp. CME 23]
MLAGQSAQALPADAGRPATPQQQVGTAAGKKHEVSAAVTGSRARSKIGAFGPGKVKGAVKSYRPHGRQGDPVNSGSRVHKAPKSVSAPSATKPRGFEVSTSVEQHGLDTATTTVYKNADGTYTAQIHTHAVNYRRADGSWARITGTVPNGASTASYRTSRPALMSAGNPTGQGNASSSTYVESGVTQNFHGNGQLYVGKYQSHDYNSFLQFGGFGAQFANDYIVNSTLWLDTEYSGQDTTGTCSSQAVNVAPVSASWDPAKIDTYPGPAAGAQIGTAGFAAGTDCSNGRQWEGVSLDTKTVMNWAHGWTSNYGLRLSAASTAAAAKEFYADDPYLAIEYTPNGAGASYSEVSYASPWNNQPGWGKVTVQNRGTATWTPTNGYKLSYQLYTVSGTTRTLLTSPAATPAAMPSTVAPNKPVTVTASIPALTAGKTYLICWDMSYNGTLFSTYGVPQTCYSLPVVNNPPIIDTFDPGNNGSVFSLTPTLAVTAHDPDNYPGTGLSYSFNVYANGSTTALASSGSLTTPVWTVPAGKLAYGKTFYWTAQVSDGNAASLWSAPDYFTIPSAPQPLVTAHLGASPYDATVKGVDPQLGDYSTQTTDAIVPGPADGPTLSVQRTYNSLDPGVFKAFGAGWSSLLDMRATEDADGTGNVVVTLADGRQERFGANGDGTYTAPAGTYAVLSAPPAAYGSSGFMLTERSGTRYIFNNQVTDPVTGQTYWALTETGNRNGHGVDLEWLPVTLTLPDGSTLKTQEPTRVGYLLNQDNGYNDGAANELPDQTVLLDLTWGVQQVTASDGTVKNVPHVTQVSTRRVSGTVNPWTYGYDGAGDLSSVCPPASSSTTSTACTQYGYTSGSGSGSHFASMVLDSNPTDYWRLGDAAGSTTAKDAVVVHEGTTDATLANVTLAQTGPLAGTPATAGSFNGTSSYMTLPDNLPANSTNLAVGMWFRTTQAGGTLFSYQSGKPGTSVSSGYVPSMYIGTDGKLRAEFWNGHAAPMTSPNAVNDGKWHYAVLSGARTDQTLFLDGAKVAGLTGSTISFGAWPYTTVGAGELAGSWPSVPSGNALGWFNGQIEDVSFLQHPLGLPAVQQEYSSATLASRELTGTTLPSGKTALAVGYDALTDRASTVTDADGGSYQFATPVTTGSDDYYYGTVRGTRPALDYPLAESAGLTAVNQYGVDNTAGGASDGIYNDVMLGEPGIFGPGGDSAAGFNGTDSYLSLPTGALDDSSGNASVALWFNTKQAGGVLFSYQNGQIGSTLSGNYTPALYVGSDGLLHGQFWDGSTSPMASKAAVNDGNWHLVVLTASGTTQTLWLDGQSQATRSGKSIAGQVKTSGETTVSVGAGYVAGSWPKPPSNALGYFNGEIGQVGLYRTDLGQSAVEAALGLYKAKGSATTLMPSTTLTVTDPAQHTETYAFDPANGNRTTAVTDADGGRTTFAYDSLGFQDAVTDPDGHSTTRQHDSYGNVLATTTCRQKDSCQTSYFSYHTNATDPLDPLNGKVLYAADARSGPTGTASPAYRTAYTYTPFGALASVTTPPTPDYPSGRTTRYWYYGKSETYTDNVGRVDTEPFGMLASVTDPSGKVTRYHYCGTYALGQVCGQTDPSGQTTYYGIDTLGHRTWKAVSSDTYPVTFSGSGAPVGGVQTQYTYDALGRTATLTGPATTDAVRGVTHTPKTTYTYDADGDLKSSSTADTTGHDTTRTTGYDYDDNDRVKTVTDPAGSVTRFTYDSFGRKSTETNAAGTTYRYDYSPTGHLLTTTLLGWTGDPTAPSDQKNLIVQSRAYDPAGRLASVTDSMGRSTAYSYFDDDLLQSQTDAAGTADATTTKAYDYDAAGNLTWECDVWSGTACLKQTQHTVDAAGRTTRTVVDPSGVDRVVVDSFDPDGNVLSRILTGGGQTRQIGYSYDAAGNRTAQSVRTDATGPTGYWPLDEGAVSAADSSGNGFTGTPGTGASWGPPGSGYTSFNGTSGAILTSGTPVVDTTRGFTVSAWAYLSATSTTKDFTVVSQQGAQNSAFQLQYNHTTKSWAFVRASNDTASATTYVASDPTPATAGTWTQLVGVYDALGAMSLYVNGVEVSGNCLNCTLVSDPTPMASTTGVAIGRGKAAGASVNWFTGRIRDVQLYGRELDDAEISQLYKSSTTAGESPVSLGAAGWWKLDDGENPTAGDHSGAGNAGTLNASTSWSPENGGSAVFAGAGQITTGGPVLDTTRSFSVSAWAKITTTPSGTWQTVLAQQGAQAAGFSLDYNPTAGRWAFDRATTDVASPTLAGATSTAAPTLNTWTHLVGTYDANSGKMTLYVNGTAQNTATDTTPIAGSGPLVIGRGYTAGAAGQYFNGSVSKVQTYNRVLSAAEVSALRTSGGTAGSAPLTTTWTYDQRGLPLTMTDPRGNAAGATAAAYTTTYAYDEDGRLTSTTSPPVSTESGGGAAQQTVAVAESGYDTFGEQVESDDADGNIVTTTYDLDGRVQAVSQPAYTPPDGSGTVTPTTSYTYDALGAVHTETDPLNHTASYVYDQLGDRVQQTLPGGQVTHVGYDTDGEVLNTTDPTGARTESTYDGLGRRATSTQVERAPTPAAYTTHYGYDGLGDLNSIEDPLGNTATATYDALGETSTVTDPLGNTTAYSYDVSGQLVRTTAADSTAATLSYDQAERLVATAQLDADGTTLSSTSYGYDAAGNQTSATDARQHTTTATFDALDRTVSQTQPVDANSSITTSFGYDAAGNETRYTDADKNVTYYTYNPLGLQETSVAPSVTGLTSAADRTTAFSYDADGHQHVISRPGGVTLTESYDDNGLLTAESGSGAEAATATRAFRYDDDGRLTSLSAPTGNDTFTYDDRGLLLTMGGPGGSATYAYDANGEIATRTDATGNATFGYDADGRVNSETDPLTGTTATLDYTKLGQPKTVSYGKNGATRGYDYNGLHQLTTDVLKTPSGTVEASAAYTYNADGQMATRTTTGTAGSGTSTFDYDYAGRLKSATTGSATTSYGYDANGNRTSAGSDTATYNARNELTSVTRGSATTTYGYTARGTTSSITSGGSTTTYTSDAFDELTGTSAGGSYSYDGLGRLATATSGGKNATFSYADGTNNAVSDGAQDFARDPAGALLAVSAPDGTGAGLALTDSHGDVTGTFTATGTALTGSTAYDAYGAPTATSGSRTDLGYQSGWTDPGTGYVNAAARWYNPANGDFTSADTVTNPSTPAVNANPYAYGNDDPLDATDTSGHDACTSDDIKAQEEAYEAQQAWLKQWQAGAWGRMEKYSQDQHAAWERENAREQARNEADERALQQQISDEERQFQNEFDDAMNWQPSGHSGGHGSGSDSGSYSVSYGNSYGVYGSSGGSYSSLYYGVALGGGALTYGYGATRAASMGAAEDSVGELIVEELSSMSAEEVLEAAALALAASAADDCGAHGIPTRPKNQNLGGVNTTPVLGVTPDEDPAAASGHLATSSSAAVDTSVATATNGSTGNGTSTDEDDQCGTLSRDIRYQYQDLDEENRAQGATALICPSDLKPSGSKRDSIASVPVAGFPDGPSNSLGPGKSIYNKTHIIGDQFNGAPKAENLFTGFDRMNKSGMRRCEKKMEAQLKQGNWVQYSGQLEYANDTDPIPTGIRMTASTKAGPLFDVTVENNSSWQDTC